MSQDTVHRPQLLKREESRSGIYRTEVLPLTSLTPYCLAKPAHTCTEIHKAYYIRDRKPRTATSTFTQLLSSDDSWTARGLMPQKVCYLHEAPHCG